MICGIVASQEAASPAGPSYAASAVHFDGSTVLVKASLTSTVNSFFSFAGWFKVDWSVHNSPTQLPTAWIIDPANNYGCYFQIEASTRLGFSVVDAPGSNYFAVHQNYTVAPSTNNAWQHIMGAIDSNHAAGSKVRKLYFGDSPSTFSESSDSTSAFNSASNGLALYVGGDSFNANLHGDVADLSIWPGVSFLTAGDISLTTRRLFIDGSGKPVAPSVAIAALGTPAIMLSGNAASFASNSLGSAGALSVSTGSLTNATTHP